MGHSKVSSVKRQQGAPDLASRAKVFGPDANIEALICGGCAHGEKEDWVPMMKKSLCPYCGNREEHKIKSKGKKSPPAEAKPAEAEAGPALEWEEEEKANFRYERWP